ncbi:MAG: hypothetical protein ACLFQX_00110 [Candidatus Kapaibacterium sp.]
MKFYLTLFIAIALVFTASESFAQPMVEPGSEQEQMQEPEEEKMQEPEEKMEEPGQQMQEPGSEQEQMMMDEPQKVPEHLRYYKDKYEAVYNRPFEDVWAAVKESVKEIGCMVMTENYRQTDEGFFKGVIKSDMCVFVEGDETLDSLKKYSLKVPVIRGGIWTNGRMQYKFILKEQEDASVELLLNGEVSGWEDHVTSSVHFWQSNGMFETFMLNRINRKLEEE